MSGHGEYVASSASGHDTALQHSISVQCDDPQVLQASAAHRNTERLLIGVMPVEVSDLYDIIHRYCSTEAFNFVCVPLVHPFFDRDAGAGTFVHLRPTFSLTTSGSGHLRLPTRLHCAPMKRRT